MQRQELNVKGARGDAKELVELAIPDKYRWVPAGFDVAVTRHRLIDAIVRASGERDEAGSAGCKPVNPSTHRW
jgi:hypothetical protein